MLIVLTCKIEYLTVMIRLGMHSVHNSHAVYAYGSESLGERH